MLKSERREQKSRKNRYGMAVGGSSVKLLEQIIQRRAEEAQKKHERGAS